MTVREWAAAAADGTDMKYMKLTSPVGDEFRLAHAWRVGNDDPPQLGLFLYFGDATEGECKTVFTSYDSFMDDWSVRSS